MLVGVVEAEIYLDDRIGQSRPQRQHDCFVKGRVRKQATSWENQKDGGGSRVGRRWPEQRTEYTAARSALAFTTPSLDYSLQSHLRASTACSRNPFRRERGDYGGGLPAVTASGELTTRPSRYPWSHGDDHSLLVHVSVARSATDMIVVIRSQRLLLRRSVAAATPADCKGRSLVFLSRRLRVASVREAGLFTPPFDSVLQWNA